MFQKLVKINKKESAKILNFSNFSISNRYVWYNR